MFIALALFGSFVEKTLYDKTVLSGFLFYGFLFAVLEWQAYACMLR